jgi:hypothetical protein
MKTSELTGAALDWAVAQCEGRGFVFGETDYTDGHTYQRGIAQATGPHYSTDWAHGGPIIEREGLSIRYAPKDARGAWYAVQGPNRFLSPDHEGSGPTPLIAAMRCYVASKLGDDVDVPDMFE